MVRSMYSGVSGMKAHQARMDVIGNNISNVNTYGFKSSRASFRDVYYQTMSSASAASTNQGGLNPSQIGYGSQIGSVDVMQTRSSFAMTDNGMDVAIAGEGFFQVQDGDGNIFYTRAGMLNIDSAGNLVDLNGNFVLGVSGESVGKAPDIQRIQATIKPVEPKKSMGEEIINNVNFKIEATNQTKDGNVVFNFVADAKLPEGQLARAKVESSTITIYLNENETIADMAELQGIVNSAIKDYRGGDPHPAGDFIFTADPDFQNLKGKEILSADRSAILGTIGGPNEIINKKGLFGAGMTIDKLGSAFSGVGAASTTDNTIAATFKQESTPGANDSQFNLSMTVGGQTYTGIVKQSADGAKTVILTNTNTSADPNDTITLKHNGFKALVENNGGKVLDDGTITDLSTPVGTYGDANFQTAIANRTTAAGGVDERVITGAIVASQPSKNLGLSSKAIKLKDGTEGGPQTVADLSSVGIGADGIVSAIHPVHGRIELGRIDLATFENPQGLEQAGNTYFVETANSGKAKVVQSGTSGSGALAAGSLEMSNVDLSREFSDMITTQRGFQANSRLITVSDEMLNELVNLKR